MMNSVDVKAGTVTLETLLSTGYEEDDDMDSYISASYRESIGRADGLLNTANEVPRGWYHSNVWTDDDGEIRQVRGHSRASATICFTDVHDLDL